jgi:tRNA G18 (ribose-2'-O)-methylase SpoU
LADAFGVQKIFLQENLEDIQNSSRFKRTSRKTEKFVKTCFFKNTTEKISDLKSTNKKLIGIELTSESQGINTYSFSSKEAYVLILGNERLGISGDVLSQLDACLHIDLFGQNSSINVAQSCGIAMYEITRQLNS